MQNPKFINKQEEITIAGAGISGLTAGIILAQHGYLVTIYEKRSRVGSFFKKDIHTLRNYPYDFDVIKKFEELGIKISYYYPIFRETRFSPSLQHVQIYSEDEPLFYNIIRGYADERSLDNVLLSQAKKNGVEVKFSSAASSKKSDVDIIATGATKKQVFGYGHHFQNISIESHSLYYFLKSINASYTFSYVVPFSEKEASVMIVTLQHQNKRIIEQEFNTLINENRFIREAINGADFENETYGYASFQVPDSAVKKNQFYVGGAAGFLDGATYYGTHYAILSGYCAAQSILRNQNYDTLWKETFGEELQQRMNRRKQLEKLGIHGQNQIIDKLVKTYGNKVTLKEYKEFTHTLKI